jgi:site-specific recombinase XerD
MEEVRGRLRLKHYSLRTEKAYLCWIRRYIHANGKVHPRLLGGVHVERFLIRLAVQERAAASTQNQALAALLFLYREGDRSPVAWMENVVRAKQPRRLPVVLSKAEVAALLRGMTGREWLMASLLYGSVESARPLTW